MGYEAMKSEDERPADFAVLNWLVKRLTKVYGKKTTSRVLKYILEQINE